MKNTLLKPNYLATCLLTTLVSACGGGGNNSADTPNPNPDPEPPQVQTPVGPTGEEWIFCADDTKTCSFTGTHEVAYGNNGKYTFAEHSDGVLCNSETFVDPNPDGDNYCWSRELATEEIASISLDASATKQQILMMGGDMERSHRNFHQAANQEEIIQWLVEDIKFDTWRVAYDKHQEDVEGSKDFSIYDNSVLAMQMIKATNPDIKFFATLESDYNGYSQGNRNNLPTFIYDYSYENGASTGSKSFDGQKYGLFLADYVEYMEQAGVPLTYLAMSKEYVGVITAERTKIALETLISELSSRNIQIPKIVDAGTWSLSNGIKLINNYDSLDINQHVYGYSSHDYWSSEIYGWQDFANKANSVGKLAFNDESGHGGGGPTLYEAGINTLLGAYSAKTRMYAGGIQGEAIFELWPRGYNEIQTNKFFAKPIFFNKGTDGRRLRAYYVMQKFVNAAVNSQYVSATINEQPSLETMAFKQGEQLALWVINQADTEANNVTIDIDNFTLKSGMQVEQTYWDENSAIEGVTNTLDVAQDKLFTATLKGRSLNVFIIKANYPLNSEVSVNGGAWIAGNQLFVEEGDSVKLKADTSVTGSWAWQGPNGYTATTQEIQLDNVSALDAGDYQVTFTDEEGVSSQQTHQVLVNCATDPVVTTAYQINQDGWINEHALIDLNAGDSLEFAPQSDADGSWTWSGPNAFSYAGKDLKIKTIKTRHSGKYITTFTSAQGCSVKTEFEVNASCSSIPNIVPRMHIGGAWSETNTLEFRAGDTFQIGPTSPEIGRWQWTGPNNFKAIEVQQLQFSDANTDEEGEYTVTFTTPAGCSATETFTTKLVEGDCTPAKVTPYFRVNTGTWLQTNTASIKVGDTLDIGPQPHGGSWTWSGPNGYSSSDRQIQLANVTLSESGTYTATYTPDNGGCPGQVTFELQISE